MERMKALLGGTAVLLTLAALVSCQDMVLRDTVVQKVAEAQNPPSKGGRLTLEYNATGQGFGSTLNLPQVTAPSQTVYHLTIRNTGQSNLTGNAVSLVNPTGAGGSFAVTSQPPSPIAPGGASSFDLTLNATATGTPGATLQIASNDLSHPTFTLNLAVTTVADGPAALGLEYGSIAQAHGAALSLPAVKASAGPSALNFTLRNSGGSNLTGNAVSIVNPTGTGGTFGVSLQPNSPIAPAGASSFQVTYTPGAGTGTAAAILQIVSNDPTHPTFTLNLSAKTDGTAPTGSVAINSGAALTNTTTVNLTLAGTDTGGNSATPAQMQFSNDNSNYSAPEAYSTTKTGYLLAGGADGVRTVYLKLIDAVGNVSSPITSTITLDTTKPTASFSVTGTSPSVSKSTSVTVNFNEAMQTSTLTTSSVKLLLPNGTPVTLRPTTGFSVASATSVILQPASNLPCGTTFTIQVTTAAKDAVGNAMNTYNGTFTTENDQYENGTYAPTGVGTGNDNDSMAHAFDLSNVYGSDGNGDPWTPGNYNFFSVEMQNVSASGLAQVSTSTDYDYYTFSVSPGEMIGTLRIRAYYSNDGTTVASSGSDVISVGIGFRPSSTGLNVGPPYTFTKSGQYDKEITVDLTGVTYGTGLPLDDGIYTISVYSSTFGSKRTYNLDWSKDDYYGM